MQVKAHRENVLGWLPLSSFKLCSNSSPANCSQGSNWQTVEWGGGLGMAFIFLIHHSQSHGWTSSSTVSVNSLSFVSYVLSIFICHIFGCSYCRLSVDAEMAESSEKTIEIPAKLVRQFAGFALDCGE